MATLLDIEREARDALAASRYEDALGGFARVVLGAPGDLRARRRIADTLALLGDRAGALAVYDALIEHCVVAGQPLRALLLAKAEMELDARGLAQLEAIAGRYAGAVGPALESHVDLNREAPAADPDVARRARQIAVDLKTVPCAVRPAIPLFSRLDRSAFIKVARRLKRRSFEDGQAILRQGDAGDSFFMLVEGRAKIAKDGVVVDQVSEGAVFGEMALVLRQPRTATVTADGEVELFELTRHDLELQAGGLESISQALKAFTRERLVGNVIATSPLFSTLDLGDRRALLDKFAPRAVYGDEVLIAEGTAGHEMFVVVRGELEVTQMKGAERTTLATMRAGDVIGEISLLGGRTTTATVTATSVGEVLVLDRDDFAEMLAKYPSVRATLDALAAQRLAADQARR